jgi:hypothetical protein
MCCPTTKVKEINEMKKKNEVKSHLRFVVISFHYKSLCGLLALQHPHQHHNPLNKDNRNKKRNNYFEKKNNKDEDEHVTNSILL